jgi:hypothetical protein
LPSLTQQRPERVSSAGSTGYLEHGLVAVERLIAHAYARALSLHPPGELTLPEPASSDEQAHIRALAGLYLMSQLEQASLLTAVELLAGIAVSGGTTIDLGPSAAKLLEFWRHRQERFSPEERQHLYDRLFGDEFENLMISLCEALYKLDEGIIPRGVSNPLQQAKVRALGEQLAEHLLNHTTGESAFAATDILVAIRKATEILKDSHVQHAFGAHDVWTTVSGILHRYGTPTTVDSPSLVERGKAGATILSWLADARTAIDSSAEPLVGLDNPVIAAAVDWLQSSLAIEQGKSGGAPSLAGSPGQVAKGA